MTEKELLHKRERKAKRRRERKLELAKNPDKLEAKFEAEIEAIEVGRAQLQNLYARAEDIHEYRKDAK